MLKLVEEHSSFRIMHRCLNPFASPEPGCLNSPFAGIWDQGASSYKHSVSVTEILEKVGREGYYLFVPAGGRAHARERSNARAFAESRCLTQARRDGILVLRHHNKC